MGTDRRARAAFDADYCRETYRNALQGWDGPRDHPFGTLKAWMGATHFLTRTLDRDEPPRPGLQPQANEQHLRCGPLLYGGIDVSQRRCFASAYHGVPHALGPIDLRQQ